VQWRRTPDGRACCGDVVVRQDGGGWKIEVADDWQRPMWGGSSSRGTGEPGLRDTGELSLRAYWGSAAEHRASAARSGADLSSLGQTSLIMVPHITLWSWWPNSIPYCTWLFLITHECCIQVCTPSNYTTFHGLLSQQYVSFYSALFKVYSG